MPRASSKSNFWFALSLGTLLFTPCWVMLSQTIPLINRTENVYLLPLPYKASYLSLIFLVLFVTSLFWGILEIVSRARPAWAWWAGHGLLSMALLFPLNTLRHELATKYGTVVGLPLQPSRLSLFVLAIALALLAALWLRFFRPDPAVTVLRKFIFILVPFVYLKVAQSIFGLAYYPQDSAKPVSRPAQTQIKNRVVWLLYDEMEENLAFDNRPKTISLPNLDRFVSTSLHASQALPPSYRTMLSLPSYITGKVVDAAVPKSASELLLRFHGSDQFVPWSKTPGIFNEAQAMGARTGVVGSYHPYCRLPLGIDACSFFKGRFGFSPDFTVSTQHWLSSLFPGPPALDYQFGVEQMEKDVGNLVNDPSYSLLFVHWPFPHSPWMMDPKKKELVSYMSNMEDGYFGNLELVDQSLGRLRQSMETSGLWDRSLVVITSDHWWRAFDAEHHRNDHRIPFLLKAPGQKSSIAFDKPLHAVFLHDLILDVLRADQFDSARLVSWLDQHASPPEPVHASP